MAEATREERLRALRARYAGELPGKIAAIIECWEALATATDPEAAQSELHRRVHTLTGSAGTFGYPALSDAARALEALLVKPEPTRERRLETALEELRTAATQAQTPMFVSSPTPVPAALEEEQLIFVMEDDELLGRELASQLGRFGYTVRLFADATSALAHGGPAPAAIIADVVLPEGNEAGPDVVERFKARYGRHIPALAVSSRFDWHSRLAVARAGIGSYMVKPLELSALLERLELLTQNRQEQPYRVLLVEDDALLAGHYAEVLTAAGMNVAVVNDPTRLLDVLAEHNPELVLIDLYLPGCTGSEAARVIRQDSSHLAMPIVFLSTEGARQRQLAALQTGADDFLQKPVADDELVAAVAQRAGRFRELRRLLRQDSMTRLLNHVSFKLQLEYEVARADRTGAALSVAMLDLDHFKSINDTWGHPTGDRVIRSLSQMLRRRLRKSDVSGRYGGEEFTVALPENSGDRAVPVIDGLRREFAALRQTSGTGETFSVTFSAGVASHARGMSATELMGQADRALYEAKTRGRNQVVLAPPFESAPTRS